MGLTTVCSFAIWLTLFVVAAKDQLISINNFGAVEGYQDVATCATNSRAIVEGMKALNGSHDILYVPRDSYCVQSAYMADIHNVTFRIDGKLLAQKDIDAWPIIGSGYENIIEFYQSSGITIQGSGQIQGFGYDWWLGCYTGAHGLYHLVRPLMIFIDSSQGFLIEGITMWNAPYYNILTKNTDNVEIRSMFIYVDTVKQRELFITFDNITQFTKFKFPLFPLNTDGIDPAGRNYWIHNITIRNYDDAIAVKPSKLLEWGCSENMLIENMHVQIGVGMSIGSVPPNTGLNCIRNITFKNIDFIAPVKGVYVKTNSGNPAGRGIVSGITYINLTLYHTLVYAIYIGPQQQKQPDGGGDGWWPPTQPLVSVDNITIINLTSIGGIFPWYGAGVLRCNETNPCT